MSWKGPVVRLAGEINRELAHLERNSDDKDFVFALLAVMAERIGSRANDREALCEGAQIFGEMLYYGIIEVGDHRKGLNS